MSKKVQGKSFDFSNKIGNALSKIQIKLTEDSGVKPSSKILPSTPNSFDFSKLSIISRQKKSKDQSNFLMPQISDRSANSDEKDSQDSPDNLSKFRVKRKSAHINIVDGNISNEFLQKYQIQSYQPKNEIRSDLIEYNKQNQQKRELQEEKAIRDLEETLKVKKKRDLVSNSVDITEQSKFKQVNTKIPGLYGQNANKPVVKELNNEQGLYIPLGSNKNIVTNLRDIRKKAEIYLEDFESDSGSEESNQDKVGVDKNDRFFNKLDEHDNKQQNGSDENTFDELSDDMELRGIVGKKSARYYKEEKDQIVCHNCGQKGHFEKYCMQEKKISCKYCLNNHFSQDCKQNCFKCGENGHVSMGCPNLNSAKCPRCWRFNHETEKCGFLITNFRGIGAYSRVGKQFEKASEEYKENLLCPKCCENSLTCKCRLQRPNIAKKLLNDQIYIYEDLVYFNDYINIFDDKKLFTNAGFQHRTRLMQRRLSEVLEMGGVAHIDDSAKNSTSKNSTLKIHCQYDEDVEPEFLRKRGDPAPDTNTLKPVKKANLENSKHFKKNWTESKKKNNTPLEQMSTAEYEKYLKTFNQDQFNKGGAKIDLSNSGGKNRGGDRGDYGFPGVSADRGGGYRPDSNGCFNCGKQGHIQRQCPNTQNQDGKTGSNMRVKNTLNSGCHKCGKDGHWTSACPERGKTADTRPKTCRNCYKEGHFARDCPYTSTGSGGYGNDRPDVTNPNQQKIPKKGKKQSPYNLNYLNVEHDEQNVHETWQQITNNTINYSPNINTNINYIVNPPAGKAQNRNFNKKQKVQQKKLKGQQTYGNADRVEDVENLPRKNTFKRNLYQRNQMKNTNIL